LEIYNTYLVFGSHSFGLADRTDWRLSISVRVYRPALTI